MFLQFLRNPNLLSTATVVSRCFIVLNYINFNDNRVSIDAKTKWRIETLSYEVRHTQRRNITSNCPCSIQFQTLTQLRWLANSHLEDVMITDTTLKQFLEQEITRWKQRFPAKYNPVWEEVLSLINTNFR